MDIRIKKIMYFLPLCLVALFSSCSGVKTPDDENTKGMRMWHINDEPTQMVFEGIASDFTDEYSLKAMEITRLENTEYLHKLSLNFAAKDPPDIFHSWGGGGMAEQAKMGYIRKISDWDDRPSWTEKFSSISLELFHYDDALWGVAHDLGAVGFWYNESILRSVGYESVPKDWVDFIQLLEDLKSNDIQPISLGIADGWPVMYYWVYLAMRIGGGNIFAEILNGERSFTDPAVITGGEILHSMFQNEYFQESGIGDDFVAQSGLMGDGKAAMQLMGQWALAVQAQVSEQKDSLTGIMRFAPFPRIPGGAGSISDVMGGANGFVLGVDAPVEAEQFLDFLTKPKNLQKYFDSFPGVPTVENVIIRAPGLQYVADYLSSADNFSLYPDQMFPQSIGSMLNELSGRVLLGELSAQNAAGLLQEKWDQERNQ